MTTNEMIYENIKKAKAAATEDLENLCFDMIDERYSFLCSALLWTRISKENWWLEFDEENYKTTGKSKHECLLNFYEFLMEKVFEEELQREAQEEEYRQQMEYDRMVGVVGRW